jgi:hypothetical protein
MIEMNENVVVHIGLPRAGSSFLQHLVFPNMNDVNLVNRDFLFGCLSEEKINLISNEIISYNDRIKRIHIIKKLYPDARIIFIRRKIDSWIKSLYSSYLEDTGNNFINFSEFKYKFIDCEPSFDEYIKLLKSMFKDVLVLDFEDLIKDNVSFIQDICDFIGCEFPKYENRVINKRLSKNSMKIINWIRCMDWDDLIKLNITKILKLINK